MTGFYIFLISNMIQKASDRAAHKCWLKNVNRKTVASTFISSQKQVFCQLMSVWLQTQIEIVKSAAIKRGWANNPITAAHWRVTSNPKEINLTLMVSLFYISMCVVKFTEMFGEWNTGKMSDHFYICILGKPSRIIGFESNIHWRILNA